MKRALTLTILLAFVVTCTTVRAQEAKLPSFVADSLDSYVKRGMASWKIPGLSVAIVKDGKIILSKGYGVTRVGGSEPVDENTLFMIGSNTKAFTATALAILQESGKMSLKDKVTRWMPEFKLYDTLATNSAMVCDLLSHRLGFESYQGDFMIMWSNLSRKDIIGRMSLLKPSFQFRTDWGYSNSAFVAAGELIPRITGRQWDDVVRDSILVPLKMSRTKMLSKEVAMLPNRAFPHSLVNKKVEVVPFENLDNLAPAGSIVSSAKDMTNWLNAQLDNGKLNGVQAISPKAIQAVRKPYTIMGVDPRDKKETHFYLYGLGLVITDCNGKLVYWHTGGLDGFLSTVMFVPEEKLGIVVLTNKDGNNFHQDLANEVRDAFLGLPYKGYSDKSLAKADVDEKQSTAKADSLRNVVKQGNPPTLPFASFIGRYTSERYGDIFVTLNKGKLNIAFSHHPHLVATLEHLKNNNFMCTYNHPTTDVDEVPFKVVNSQVEGLTLNVNGSIEPMPYEFKKD